MAELSGATWFTSSYTTGSQACVEVAMVDDAVGVRDSKDRRGGTLVFKRDRWAEFIASLKR